MATPVIFLDDASRHSGSVPRSEAEESAKSLINTLRELKKGNPKLALNTELPISQCQISDGWTFQVIFSDKKFKEEWDFIRLLNNSSPLSAGIENLMNEVLGMEFQTLPSLIPTISASWATLFGTLTVSYPVHSDWGESWLKLKYQSLVDDCEIIEEETKIRNASNVAHAKEHREWLQLLGMDESPSVEQIWTEREKTYSGLLFASSVLKDLEKLQGSSLAFSQMISALTSLNNDSLNWNPSASHPTYSTKATPESQTRQNLCWFYDSTTGKNELFDWHTRFTGNIAGRIHFRVDSANRKVIIGYIGAKL